METIIAHPKSKAEIAAIEKFFKDMGISFESYQTAESPYKAEFVAKIKRSEDDLKNGRYTTIQPTDIWKLE